MVTVAQTLSEALVRFLEGDVNVESLKVQLYMLPDMHLMARSNESPMLEQ